MNLQFAECKAVLAGLMMACGLAATNSWGVTPDVKIPGAPLTICAGMSSSNSKISFESGMGNFPSLSTTDLSNGTGHIYLSNFYPSKWSGGFKKYTFTLDTNGVPQIDKAPHWDAADILSGTNQHASDPTPDARKIYTTRIDGSKAFETIEFKWDSLSSSQKSALNKSPVDGKNDGLGEKRLNYLRGMRSMEQTKGGGIFRARDNVLGDIVGSNSAYVGPPAFNTQQSDYQKFYEANKNRASALYVGANDGMLHAFDADTGRELFAYIPSILMADLPQLTRPGYVHRPYVDGSSTVSNVMVDGVWKTVLASGMGGGAQGVFALDITNPSDFGSGVGALWEFTDADDADMGNQMAAPVIAKFKIGTLKGKPEYKYFVVVSSGLNNYKADGSGKFDGSGDGALFLLSLDKAPSEKWKRNINYFKFITPIKDTAAQNGLSTPALVIGSNGAVRYVYAGDLQGNLWRFDFTGNAPWIHALRSESPVFTAKDWRGEAQPITTQPKVIFAPGGGYVVLFGTGKFIEEADMLPTDFKTQSFYGIHDTTKNSDTTITRRQLALRTLAKDYDGALKIIGSDFSYGTTLESRSGWYVDFPDSEQTGERSITNAAVTSEKIFFNTLLPAINPCGASNGRSYALDALTGLSGSGDKLGQLAQIGILDTPMVFQTIATKSGQAPSGNDKGKNNDKGKKKDVVINFGTGGAMGTMSQSKAGTDHLNNAVVVSRRFGWREILN
jgi:type IV pilus assembly protein PilY1